MATLDYFFGNRLRRVAGPLAAALLGTTAVASAQQVDVTNVTLDPYFTEQLDVSGFGAENAGVILLTTTTGSILPVFCVDLYHDIYVQSYNPALPYAFGAVTTDSSGPDLGNGNPLKPAQEGAIQALATQGYHDYVTNDLNANDYVAIQGAIWQIEYTAAVTSTDPNNATAINTLISGDVNWADSNPLSYTEGLYPVGPGGQGFGTTQGFVTGVPEASTWAMMAMGFASLGYAAFRRTGKREPVTA